MAEPCDLTAVEARRLIGARALSPVDLVDCCIRRIEHWNPHVNAVVTTNAQGVPTVALPTSGDQLTPTGGYEQRQIQLGFKITF